MSLETQRPLNIRTVFLFRATAHAFLKKVCLNQIRAKGLDHVDPNSGRVSVEKIGIAASNNFLGRVTRNINQPC